MAKKGCELCSNPATMFCDSDQASLCWDCDEKVHAANFLVAKHSRTLLCHVCQSPTPWNAAGPNLGRTVSVCHACTLRGDEDSQESESDDGEYDTDVDDFSEEEGENQVVPWSDSASDSPPPPPAAAASSSDSEENVCFSSLKRTRENRDESEDENGGCSSPSDESDSCSESLLRPLKNRRRSGGSPGEEEPCFSGTAAIVERLRRFESVEGDASEIILGLCKLAGD